MDNKMPTPEELSSMTDTQLEANGFERFRGRGGVTSIRRIQLVPQATVAKLEEIHPESLIHDAVFPPKSKANDFSLFAGYFLEQVLGQYIPRIQSAGLLRDQEIKGIVNILGYYDYLRIGEYLLALPVHNPNNKLSIKYSQFPERIGIEDRVKMISEVVSRLKYQLESWQQS